MCLIQHESSVAILLESRDEGGEGHNAELSFAGIQGQHTVLRMDNIALEQSSKGPDVSGSVFA